jgi:hypothetical protein
VLIEVISPVGACISLVRSFQLRYVSARHSCVCIPKKAQYKKLLKISGRGY